jgi:hypothetical protein
MPTDAHALPHQIKFIKGRMVIRTTRLGQLVGY